MNKKIEHEYEYTVCYEKDGVDYKFNEPHSDLDSAIQYVMTQWGGCELTVEVQSRMFDFAIITSDFLPNAKDRIVCVISRVSSA